MSGKLNRTAEIEAVDAAYRSANALLKQIEALPKSRETALAITHQEDVVHRLKRARTAAWGAEIRAKEAAADAKEAEDL